MEKLLLIGKDDDFATSSQFNLGTIISFCFVQLQSIRYAELLMLCDRHQINMDGERLVKKMVDIDRPSDTDY
jgi:hypothetical protein